jgi:hypothetical protein
VKRPFPPFDEKDGIPSDWTPLMVERYLEWKKQQKKEKEEDKNTN